MKFSHFHLMFFLRTGCKGGDFMNVSPGTSLKLTMASKASVWTQTIRDLKTGKSVSYTIDMKGQGQAWAE
jgi:hypothetical protein